MPWAWQRRTSWILLAPALLGGGCGLLSRRPRLPDPQRVEAARAAQAEEWQRLEDAFTGFLLEGSAALASLREEVEARPGRLRLAALLQDLEVRSMGSVAVLEQEEARYRRDPSPRNAWLLARIHPDRSRAVQLLRDALAAEPDLVLARIRLLGLEARAGDDRVLDELVELLARHPGAAEGWRLLGTLAPLYGRRDLAMAAAATEPWSPLEDERAVRLLQARADLDHGRSGQALDVLAELPPEDREASLLRAAALAQGGYPGAARRELERLLHSHAEDVTAHFDLGLLALDYLGDPGLAVREFEKVLALAETGAELPLQRRIQAEMWLERARRSGQAGEP